jgi:protein-disulfide isomerase
MNTPSHATLHRWAQSAALTLLVTAAACCVAPLTYAASARADAQEAAAATATPAEQQSPAAATPGAEPVDPDGRMLGRPDAPVSIIEFTDLQCPYCARFATETWPQLKARYVDTGKVRFASRDLPLAMHAHAMPAAIAARCAGRQGHFWDYREALFRDQGRLAQAPYDELAGRMGLDVPAFAACRADPSVAASVRSDVELAQRNGIAGTPSFVVGSVRDGRFEAQLIRGAQPLQAFEQAAAAARPVPLATTPRPATTRGARAPTMTRQPLTALPSRACPASRPETGRPAPAAGPALQ